MRYVANNLRGCQPCLVGPGGYAQTWPETVEDTHAATLAAARNLRHWVRNLPGNVQDALAELDLLGPELFNPALAYPNLHGAHVTRYPV